MTSGQDGKKLTIKLQIVRSFMENGRVVLELSESCVTMHAQHAPFLTTGVVFVVRTKFSSSSA